MPRGIAKAGKRVTRAAERRAARPIMLDPNQFYSVQEAAAARDQSPAKFWDDINNGRVQIVRDGSRVKVLGAELIRMNQQQAADAIRAFPAS